MSVESTSLTHYGVPGMRWGIRKTRYTAGGVYTDRKKRKFKREAMSILRKESKDAKTYSKIFENKANKDYAKADKHVWTSERAQAKGDQAKFEKYQGKAWNKLLSSSIAERQAKAYLERSKKLDKTFREIEHDELKAGRDYVVNKSYHIGVDIPLGTVLERKRQIDFRQK